MEKIKKFWLWFISKIFPRYTLKVSYNDTWGDQDDQEYIVKKFYKKHWNFFDFDTFKIQKGEISEKFSSAMLERAHVEIEKKKEKIA